jgi:uncharacterized protein (TIGR03435 family)
MTGLPGRFNLDLIFAPETTRRVFDRNAAESASTAEPVQSIVEAVQQSMGLQLEARKAPLELLTVTHLEKTPTDN